MKNRILLLALVAIVILGNLLFTGTGCSSGIKGKGSDSISKSYARIPLDIYTQTQKEADYFSWQTFIAMNWPADVNNCGADTSNGKSILSGMGPVVWETYLASEEVFVSPPARPEQWCSAAEKRNSFSRLPKKVQELAQKTGIYRFVHRISKSSPHGLEQAVGGPLVDQNGRFVRYEVRINQDEYKYITTKSLWDTAGQRKFAQDSTVAMPAGPSSYGPVGAMEFKAAWKVLGKGDDTSKFYKIKAIVYNDDTDAPSPGPNPVTLGLVGLHIAHKTASQGNWVWSTFEQVDNLTKSFYNPNCDTCPINQPIAGNNYVELNPDGSPHNRPTQVKRVNPIQDPDVDSLNHYFQKLLKGSVWANYKLVSTQWLLFENMTPSFLANSVQETYVQGPHPASYGGFHLNIDEPYYSSPLYRPFASGISSSCMGCHYVAKLPYVNAKADFSFLLGEAH